MSPSSPSKDLKATLAESGALPSLARFGTELKASAISLKEGVSSVAFWAAIVLPFLHLPLLASGLEKPSVTLAFVGLLALNLVAVVLGQPHRRD